MYDYLGLVLATSNACSLHGLLEKLPKRIPLGMVCKNDGEDYNNQGSAISYTGC